MAQELWRIDFTHPNGRIESYTVSAESEAKAIELARVKRKVDKFFA